MFEGTHTALVTPLRERELDEAAFAQLIQDQLAAGVQGLVPVGTTGESPTLSHAEHERVVELTIEHAKGKALIIAGTGSNSTREAISLTQAAEKAGADASLQVCPYYNKPSQDGLFAHYSAIASETALPLVLYSIPGRCGIPIEIDTVVKLASNNPNIRALKEAGGDVERINLLKKELPSDFEILSGDDSLTLPFMATGAVGVVSVASNLIPEIMVKMVNAALANDWESASAIHHQYYPLFSGFLKLATNPVPIKTAMALSGKIAEELRLPMVAMPADSKATLSKIMTELKLLS